MAENGTIAYVSEMPKCQIHPIKFPDRPAPEAKYDFKTIDGPWAYGCSVCWISYRWSPTLGTGRGQKLELAP